MRSGVLLLCATLSWFSPAAAQDRSEIAGVISSQVEAFRAENDTLAFSFASPQIQRFFGTPERFITMVQRGYPMVWRPAEIRFLEQRELNGALWQKVLVRDGKSRLHLLDYEMISIDGMWRINGVRLLELGEEQA